LKFEIESLFVVKVKTGGGGFSDFAIKASKIAKFAFFEGLSMDCLRGAHEA